MTVMDMRVLRTHARADAARQLAKDVCDAANATFAVCAGDRGGRREDEQHEGAMTVDVVDSETARVREACAAFIALGLLDAEDEQRDGVKPRATAVALKEENVLDSDGRLDSASDGASGVNVTGRVLEGDITAILEESGVSLVMFLDALPEFLSASARSLALRLKSPGSSRTVAEIEHVLRIREIRSAFAFNKVIAKKFHEFMAMHFDEKSSGGKRVARIGWALYLSVKCEALPAFPDLYSCFHLLIAVEAFLLVNVPRRLLRTSLKNMVSMTTKDVKSALPDPLASLSSASKTKTATVHAMADAVVAVAVDVFPTATCDPTAHYADVAPSALCVQGIFDENNDDDNEVVSQIVARYKRTASNLLGRLAVDETLYLYAEMENENARGKTIIGDLAQCKTVTTHGSMSTPARRKRIAPFSPIRPKKIQMQGVPPSPFRTFHAVNASVVPPATPITQAMESAFWLHEIVCNRSTLDEKVQKLQSFVVNNTEVVPRLRETVEDLAQRIGQAIREDAMVTSMRTDISPQSTIMDNLVQQRTTEIVHVYFYFLNRILSDEMERITGDKTHVDFIALLTSARFTKSLLSCCMEVIVSTYKTSTLAFPATTQLLGMHPFDLATIIEPFVRADLDMPREIQRHFNSLEEKTLERLAWCKGSTLFEFLQTFHETSNSTANTDSVTTVENRGGAAAPGPSTTRIQKKPSSVAMSVASIAEVAAMGSAVKESVSDGSDEPLMPQCQSPVRRAPTSAFTAFPSPLRGVTTPRRRVLRDQPLPERFCAVRSHEVDMPSGCDVCAFKALRMFFAKVMHLAARRLGDLVSRLNLTPDVIRDTYSLIEHVVYEQTNLVYNRHLDQIILAAVYGVCKANAVASAGSGTNGGALQFKDIIHQYSKQPQSNEDIFWTVVLEQTDPELEVTRWGDIISFYNKVFVGRVKEFLLTLRERPIPKDDAIHGDQDVQDEPLPPGLSSPRRRLPINNQNIYVSPMRPERIHSIATIGVPPTPRTRSLFATIGESAHSYRTASHDFEVLNRKIAASGGTPSRFADSVTAPRDRVPKFCDTGR
jgi:retinoblastoma-like protein 1